MLKAEGYAGLTTAKVAARSGENKALIAYHFGSKRGLVAAAAREVAEAITEEVLSGLDDTDSAEGVVGGVLDGRGGCSTATSAWLASTSTWPPWPWWSPTYAR